MALTLPASPVRLPIVKWKWRCFRDDQGTNVVIDWVTAKSKGGQARLKNALDQLSQLEKQHWHKPQPSSSIGNHIYVIRFSDENRTQWRIYGHHKDAIRTFVLTNYGTERGNKYDPPVERCLALGTERMDWCAKHWNSSTCSCLSTGSAPGLSTTGQPASDGGCS